MNIDLGCAKVSGEFRAVVKRNGSVVKESDWNNNLLLDTFFSGIGIANIRAAVGTGSTPPSPTDTALASPLGGDSAVSTSTGSASISGDAINGYLYTTRTYILSWPQGAIVGNLSEYLLKSSNSNTAFVRSLFKDANGDPTTISVGPSDQLEIWWRLKKQAVGSANMSSVTQQFTLNGAVTDVTCKNINPELFSSVNNFSPNISPEIINPGWAAKLVTAVTPGITEIIDSNAGDDLTITTSSPSEQSILTQTPTATQESPGVARVSRSLVFGLNANASSNPTLAVLLDLYGTQNYLPKLVMSVVTFSPQFIKGTDKVLTVNIGYTVTRGS